MDAKCPVCRDDIATMPADHRMLPLACGHLFCAPCIEHWFGQESTCPTCRRPHPSLRRCAQSTADAWRAECEAERSRERRAPARSPLNAGEAEPQRGRDDGRAAAAGWCSRKRLSPQEAAGDAEQLATPPPCVEDAAAARRRRQAAKTRPTALL